MYNPFDFDNEGEISLDEEILGTGLLLDMLDYDSDDDLDDDLGDDLDDEIDDEQIILGYENMALISCPECGKEKVSNTAPTCPGCGFAIREYFEKIEQRKLAREQQKQAEETRKRDAENKIQYEKSRMATVTMPSKPTRQKRYYVIIGVCALVALVKLMDETIGLLGLIYVFPIMGLIYCAERNYKEANEKYELAKSNFEKYQKEELRLRDVAEANARIE